MRRPWMAVLWLLVVVLATAAVARAFTFSPAPGSPFAVGRNPVSVAVGDFNGDGRSDLVVTNDVRRDGLSVLLAKRDGGFRSEHAYRAGRDPGYVAVGDFNGDGHLDLAVASNGSVSVLLGNGTGGFTAAPGSPFAPDFGAGYLGVGDFNGDGRLDLAVVDGGNNTVSVLLGNGRGGFSAAPGGPVRLAHQPFGAAVGDFNGDGRPDLAIATDFGHSIYLLLGNGQGGFRAAPSFRFRSGFKPISVVVGDFNGDRRLDIAAWGTAGVWVLLGNGRGGFRATSGSPLSCACAGGLGFENLAVADFNADGKLDLALSNRQGGVSVLLGNGRGGLRTANGSPFRASGGTNFVAVGDFNGDRRPDIAAGPVGSLHHKNVSVLLNIQSRPAKG